MSNIRRLILLALTLGLFSCATQKWESERYVPENLYDLSVSYDHEEKVFLLNFISKSEEEICIARMSWADEKGGHYFFGDRNVYFTNDGIRYEIKDLATGYCASQEINGCINILKKNDQILGKVPLKDFVVPSEIYLSESFNPNFNYPYPVSFCTSKK